MAALKCLSKGLQMLLILAIALKLTTASSIISDQDPQPIVYPGQVNIGLLLPLRQAGTNGTLCGTLQESAVQQALGVLWAVRDINKRKEPKALNLGLYIYDTCSQSDVALRQTLRISELSSSNNPTCHTGKQPLLGVLTNEESSHLHSPVTILEATSTPLIVSSPILAEHIGRHHENLFVMDSSSMAKSRAVVSLLKHLVWKDVALINPVGHLNFTAETFRKLSHRIGINVVSFWKAFNSTDFNSGSRVKSVLRTVEEFGLQATVVFAESQQTLDFLHTLRRLKQSNHQWIIITTADAISAIKESFSATRLKTIKNVIFIAPQTEKFTEPLQYFQQLLQSGGHPLVEKLVKEQRDLRNFTVYTGSKSRNQISSKSEILDSEGTIDRLVMGVWTLWSALDNVQKSVCSGPGSSCLKELKKYLPGDVRSEIGRLNCGDPENESEKFLKTRLCFTKDGFLATSALHVFLVEDDGDLKEVAWYTDESGLLTDSIRLSPSKFPTAIQSNSAAGFSSANLKTEILPVHANSKTRSLAINDEHQPNFHARSFIIEEAAMNDSPTIEPPKFSFRMWLSRPWAIAILCLSGAGTLVTLYIFIFMLMKGCEGTLNKYVLLLDTILLISTIVSFSGSALYTFQPTPWMCSMRHFWSNVSLTLCYGSLLIRAMHLRAQKYVGLGGRVSRLNQVLTLVFAVGVQLALEIQRLILLPAKSTDISVSTDGSLPSCGMATYNHLVSQAYPGFLLLLAIVVTLGARGIPFSYRDARCLLATTVCCLPVFTAWLVGIALLSHAQYRDMVTAITMLITSAILLGGIIGPQLRTIHKHGGIPHKPLSYSDSLSTVFSMFKDKETLSNSSGSSSRGKKAAKSLDSPFGRRNGEMRSNPLYDDYLSAYP